MRNHTIRQHDIVPEHILKQNYTIIGAGSVGSFLTLALSKMGVEKITVIDFDKVDIENMSCQFHGFKDIGRPKVESLMDRIHEITLGTTRVVPINDKWTGKAFPGIVVMAVDSLEVRQQIWESHKDNFDTKFIIDARMGAEVASIQVVNPHNMNDREKYPNSFTSDAKAVQEPCTAKSTTYCAIVLSGLIASFIKDCQTREDYLFSSDIDFKTGTMNSWRKSV